MRFLSLGESPVVLIEFPRLHVLRMGDAMRVFRVSLFSFVLICCTANAATYLVAPDGSGDYPTIQAAIDAVANGDSVLLADGNFSGEGNRDVDFSGKAITVRSATGDPVACVINCEGTADDPHDGFIFQSEEGPESQLIGITIRGVYDGPGVGLGLRITATDEYQELGASPTIENCIFRECARGVATEGNASAPLFLNCVFRANGHGVNSLLDGGPDFVDCLFDSNGIGLYIYDPYYGSEIEVRDCVIKSNYGHGARCILDYGNSAVSFRRCDVVNNMGTGIWALSSEEGTVAIDSCLIRLNVQDGVKADHYLVCEILNSDILENGGNGIAQTWDGGCFQNNNIKDNGGIGIHLGGAFVKPRPEEGSDLRPNCGIQDCRILNNSLGGIVGGSIYGGSIEISGCIVAGNWDVGVHIVSWSPGFAVSLLSTTIVGNDAEGVILDAGVFLDISNVIVSGNNSTSVVPGPDMEMLTIECSDFHGNAGGSWEGDLAEYLGVNGNISADPRFCSEVDGDFTLLEISPCLSGNHPDGYACGLIGAYGQGCMAAPCIESIEDVGNDQGLRVRIIWERSHYDDVAASDAVTEYGIYRRQDEYFTEAGGSLSRTQRLTRGQDARELGWDFLVTVPARGDAAYQYVAETLCDSTGDEGICWSAFFVSAMTNDPFTFYDSPVDSGYSVDNLEPEPPSGLAVAYAQDGNTLHWAENEEEDLRYYHVYRSSWSEAWTGCDDENAELVATVTGTMWHDDLVDTEGDAWDYCYLLTAVDWAGNTSQFARDASPTDVAEPPSRSFVCLSELAESVQPDYDDNLRPAREGRRHPRSFRRRGETGSCVAV